MEGGGGGDGVTIMDEQQEPKEKIGNSPTEIVFCKLGGTWDMIERDGRRVGTGNLDDDALRQLQTEAGLFDTRTVEARAAANWTIAQEVYTRMRGTSAEAESVGTHLSTWARTELTQSHDTDSISDSEMHEFSEFADGQFFALFSGDSSHLTNPIVAPMMTTLIEKARENPQTPIRGGMGTDTADIALLGLWDGLTFDTDLPGFVLAGSNDPHSKEGSDAPKNFVDLARVSTIELASGGYWLFDGNLYRAHDLTKVDPQVTRKIEDQTTFFAPHGTQKSIDELVENSERYDKSKHKLPPPEHIVNKLEMKNLYDALDSVYTIDLGTQNSGTMDMEKIYDPSVKAIVVAAHSFGNMDNERRNDLVTAAKMGKTVIVGCRALVGTTNLDYEASILSANDQELKDTGNVIIDAHELNISTARALAVRSILEGSGQAGANSLFAAYADSRKLAA